MTAPILIVSHAGDVHALEVLRHLEGLGADALLLDTARLPCLDRLTVCHGIRDHYTGSLTLSGRRVDPRAVRAVWWRRPQPMTLHTEITAEPDRRFAFAETAAALEGLWSLLDARWINEPDRDAKASRKAWQLEIARQSGLVVPKTCITNDPDEARGFVDAVHGRVAYKAFQGTEHTWRETRILSPDEREQLTSVRFAPVIFQQYVAARVDLRITIVGDELFPAEIDSQASAYPHDFRMDLANVAIRPHTLPSAVVAGLQALMQRLGLVYGAIDMRQTPEGQYVFLEVNPAGQWLFIEQRTGQPISRSLAMRLHAFSRG